VPQGHEKKPIIHEYLLKAEQNIVMRKFGANSISLRKRDRVRKDPGESNGGAINEKLETRKALFLHSIKCAVSKSTARYLG
jgi:hypothetical protein